MDINFLRGVVAAVSLAMFAGIVIWAWSKAQDGRFDEASKLPFNEKD